MLYGEETLRMMALNLHSSLMCLFHFLESERARWRIRFLSLFPCCYLLVKIPRHLEEHKYGLQSRANDMHQIAIIYIHDVGLMQVQDARFLASTNLSSLTYVRHFGQSHDNGLSDRLPVC